MCPGVVPISHQPTRRHAGGRESTAFRCVGDLPNPGTCDNVRTAPRTSYELRAAEARSCELRKPGPVTSRSKPAIQDVAKRRRGDDPQFARLAPSGVGSGSVRLGNSVDSDHDGRQ